MVAPHVGMYVKNPKVMNMLKPVTRLFNYFMPDFMMQLPKKTHQPWLSNWQDDPFVELS